MQLEDYASVGEATAYVGVTKTMVYRRLHGLNKHGNPSGHTPWTALGAVQVAGRWLIPWKLVREYAKERA